MIDVGCSFSTSAQRYLEDPSPQPLHVFHSRLFAKPWETNCGNPDSNCAPPYESYMYKGGLARWTSENSIIRGESEPGVSCRPANIMQDYPPKCCWMHSRFLQAVAGSQIW